MTQSQVEPLPAETVVFSARFDFKQVGGFSFTLQKFGLGLCLVETGEEAPGRDHIALLRYDLDHAPGDFGRDVDLCGLDSTVDAKYDRGQGAGLVSLPEYIGAARGKSSPDHNGREDSQPFRFHSFRPTQLAT